MSPAPDDPPGGTAPSETWHPVGGPSPGAGAPPQGGVEPLPANWFSPLNEVRRKRKRFDARRFSHIVAAGVVGLVLLLVLSNLALQIWLMVSGEPPAGGASNEELVYGLIINMVVFIGAPLLWVSIMYYGGAEALRERLFLTSAAPGKDVLIGIGVGLLGLLVSVAAVMLFEAMGLRTDNPVVEGLGGQLTWSLVIFIPFAAATSEELFFRAYLQPRMGMVPANLFFGVVHLSYQTPLQVLVPMMLGFLFSWTLLRRRSILPAVVGHFVFNLVGLTLTKLSHDLGWT